METIVPADGPYVIYEGKKLLDLSSCDFLGLSQHPEVKKEAIKYTLKYGVAALTYSTIQHEIEAKLAQYLGKETALLFSCLPALQGLKIADNTYLMGVTGPRGFGSSADLGLVCGALLCTSGAFVAGPKKQLASLSPGVLSFPVLGALSCALSLIPEMDAERKMIHEHKAWLLKQLSPFPTEELRSPRILLKSPQAEAIRQFFLQEQIYLSPCQDQTLCFSMTALHTADDLDLLSQAFKKLAATDLALAMQSLTPTPSK
jgi:7-keto-8-aminopelargonate synthetase-like enzyme